MVNFLWIVLHEHETLMFVIQLSHSYSVAGHKEIKLKCKNASKE